QRPLAATAHPAYAGRIFLHAASEGEAMSLSLLGRLGLLGGAAFLAFVPATGGTSAEEPEKAAPFIDRTRDGGLDAIVADKSAASPKWWLSGLHLVALDGDGHLDFFMSAHGGGGAVAALNDGKGHFKLAPGDYPTTEIHLAYDLDEDGLVDLTMTHQDGGSKWWLNRSRPGLLRFEPTRIERGTNTGRRQAIIDINRDGKADWLRGVPNVLTFDLADGLGGFTPAAGTLRVGDTARAEVLCLPVDIDGDGLIDLLAEWGHYGHRKGHRRVYRNDGQGHFEDVTEACGLRGTDFAIKGVADVNQDGAPDLLVLEDLKPEVYLNDGTGKFTRKAGAIAGI